MRTMLILLGLVCGAVFGTVLGFAGAVGLGIFSQWQHPNDPSAGSVAIVVIATAPGGCMLGAAIGAGLAARWTKKPKTP